MKVLYFFAVGGLSFIAFILSSISVFANSVAYAVLKEAEDLKEKLDSR